jgi:hypothetical protein
MVNKHLAILWPSRFLKKKLPFHPKENQFNIHKAFNQNVQYPHAIVETH